MKRDDLSDLLPGNRFITIHPTLLDIMSYQQAAFLHEIRWRAADERSPEGWVLRRPDQWHEALHLSPDQFWRMKAWLVETGIVESEKPVRRPGDQALAYRIGVVALRDALDSHSAESRSGSAESRNADSAESRNVYRKEEPEELIDVSPSIPSMPSVLNDDSSNSTTSSPPPTPSPVRNSGSYEQPEPEQFNRDIPMRRADSIERFLIARGDIAFGGAQESARNLSKLADMRPTANQLDAVADAVKAGDAVQLGRLVQKFPTLRESAKVTKPDHWKTPKDRRKEEQAAAVANGADPYDKMFITDYGVGRS